MTYKSHLNFYYLSLSICWLNWIKNQLIIKNQLFLNRNDRHLCFQIEEDVIILQKVVSVYHMLSTTVVSIMTIEKTKKSNNYSLEKVYLAVILVIEEITKLDVSQWSISSPPVWLTETSDDFFIVFFFKEMDRYWVLRWKLENLKISKSSFWTKIYYRIWTDNWKHKYATTQTDLWSKKRVQVKRQKSTKWIRVG